MREIRPSGSEGGVALCAIPTMRTTVKPFGLVFYVMVVVWSGRGLRGSLLPRLRG